MKKCIPKPFEIDDISLKVCFSAPSYRIFSALLVGWVLTVGTHRISKVILTMGLHESRHFATIYRFLDKGQWSAERVSYRLFRMLMETLIASGVQILAVVDDTLNKRCGKKICGAGWQHDGSASKLTKQKGYGLCFVIGLAIRIPKISDRIFCLPYAAGLWWPPKAKVKPEGLPYKTKTRIGLDLINLTRSWLREGERMIVAATLATAVRRSSKDVPKMSMSPEGFGWTLLCLLPSKGLRFVEEAGLGREVVGCRRRLRCFKTRT